jgi:hypothetical protein
MRGFGWRLGVAGLAVLFGCTSGGSTGPVTTVCSAVGGYSGIFIEGEPASKVCLDGECVTPNPDVNGVMARFNDVHETEKSHRLEVTSLRGLAGMTGPIPFELRMPNGPGCGPRLYQATFTLNDGKLTLH